MGLVFQLLSSWGWLVGFFAAGMALYKLRYTRMLDGRIALLALAGLVIGVPVRQTFWCCSRCSALPGAMARADAALAGDPGGALRRSFLRHLHLWLAGGGSGVWLVGWPGGVVAGVLAGVAGGGGARFPVLAPDRGTALRLKPRARASADDAASRGWRRGQPHRLLSFRSDELEGGASMRIHNLYTDANGQSHFRDIEVEWVEETRSGKFVQTPAGERHHLPRGTTRPPTSIGTRHRAGSTSSTSTRGYEITASDGEARRIGAGEVILVEDTTGKGHLSKANDGKIRNCILVPID